jgi:hypothetical protein
MTPAFEQRHPAGAGEKSPELQILLATRKSAWARQYTKQQRQFDTQGTTNDKPNQKQETP